MKEFQEEDCIALICNGEFDDVPNFPIGELFEEFFDNINYNVVRENDIFVDFTGDAFCDNEPAKILMRFKILEDLDTFEIVEVKVNDEVLSEDEILDLIEDIAFISGAIMDNDEYSEGGCTHDCAHCAGCSSLEYGELVASADFEEDDEEDDDEYEFEDDDEDND